MLSSSERYEMLKITLKECCNDLLKKTDEEINYYLFEVIPIDINSYLHKNTLNILLNEGMIDSLIYSKCIELRNYFNENIDPIKKTSHKDIKNATTVKTFARMADYIIELLYL